MKKTSILLIVSLITAAFSFCGCTSGEIKGTADTVANAADTVANAADTVAEKAGTVADVAGTVAEAAESVKQTAEDVKGIADIDFSFLENSSNYDGNEAEIEESADDNMTDEDGLYFKADREEMFKLVADMGAGFNLGNSLDSTGDKTVKCETCWGNPKTTPEMIKAISDKGFKTIRIPVSWGDHTGAAPDYEIDGEWMDRVQEVVDYAYDLNMYVILNTHHEENTWLNTDPANKDKVEAQLAATWKQICNRFKDYDHKLIFEGMNEPRLKGSAKEWSGGTAEERDVVNVLNQAFVDTVRESGGNNETRPLVICPYATSAERSAMGGLVIPEDENIIAAVHAYTPYGFTFEDPNFANYPNWSSTHKKDIVYVFQGIDKYFLQNNVPVILDEFGAQNKNNREDIDNWLKDFLEIANQYGVPCVWWDNGNYDGQGEKFAIFDRKNCSWFAESTSDILVEMQK